MLFFIPAPNIWEWAEHWATPVHVSKVQKSSLLTPDSESIQRTLAERTYVYKMPNVSLANRKKSMESSLLTFFTNLMWWDKGGWWLLSKHLLKSTTGKWLATFRTTSAFVIRSELRRRHLIAFVFAASLLLVTALGPFVLNEAIGRQ